MICLGKALTGGFPLSACVGRAELMDAAWPEASGEAIHTSTYLGHPVGCAMALAQMAEIQTRRLCARAERTGAVLRAELERLSLPSGLVGKVRGLGLMMGLELRHRDGTPAGGVVGRAMRGMLKAGYIVLPEGDYGEVIALTPPLTIGVPELRRAVWTLGRVLESTVSDREFRQAR
jgi:4-aminobutyrate aminotransferase-like enzyme